MPTLHIVPVDTAPETAVEKPAADAAASARAGAGWVVVLAVLSALFLVLSGSAAHAGQALRVAATRAPVSLPLYVALERGFFTEEGVDVRLDDCLDGTSCLRRLCDGQADIATAPEMPIVMQSFAPADFAVVATMVDASDNLKLIARKAAGITRGEQLAGRRIGVIAGTAAQYLIEMELLNVGVDPLHVTMLEIQPGDTVEALRSGRVDAVAVWEPFAYDALHDASAEETAVGVRLPLSGRYIETYNLVARRAAPGAHDATLVELLRAVDHAERFIQAHPAEAQALLRQRLQLDQRFVDWIWPGLSFRLSLNQSLLSTMESQARWAQRSGKLAPGARPNLLSLVYAGPLRTVRSSAVGTAN